MGGSKRTGSQMMNKLRPFFQSGTYDLLKKNCNSFSDCCIYYMLRKRIAGKYRSLEKKGQMFSGWMKDFGYEKNDKAEDFDVEQVCLEIREKQSFKNSIGQKMDGQNAESPNDMR